MIRGEHSKKKNNSGNWKYNLNTCNNKIRHWTRFCARSIHVYFLQLLLIVLYVFLFGITSCNIQENPPPHQNILCISSILHRSCKQFQSHDTRYHCTNCSRPLFLLLSHQVLRCLVRGSELSSGFNFLRLSLTRNEEV